MVVVGGGRLSLGASPGGPGRVVETPPKFAIGRFEVTNREWNRCVHDGHCKGKPRSSPHEPRLELRPVANVSWEDANDFVRWLTETTGERYRLPTEAEWEHAARAGVTDALYFFAATDKRPPPRAICDYANGADRRVGPLPFANPLCDDAVGREAAQVGSYKPNKFGLHDMYGNVWEWVQGCASPNAEDSNAPRSRSCAHRIARGGSWRSGPDALTSNARHAFPPAHRRPTLGFRVARDVAD
jgi:formylglycine-generating enzyme required for sulfatase activity